MQARLASVQAAASLHSRNVARSIAATVYSNHRSAFDCRYLTAECYSRQACVQPGHDLVNRLWPHYPDFDTFARLARGVAPRAGLSPADGRLAHAGLGLSHDRRRAVRLPVRERRRRREGRPLQLSGGRSVPADRGPRQSQSTIIAGERDAKSSTPPIRWPSCKRHVERFRAARLPELPPFTGGAVGYAGYDVVRYTEHLPNAPPDDRGLPDLSFAFYDRMVVFDNVNKTDRRRGDGPASMTIRQRRPARRLRRRPPPRRRHWSRACRAPDARAARRPTSSSPASRTIAYRVELHASSSSKTPSRKCVEYIRAGDIFQVVISQRLRARRPRAAVRDLSHAAGREPQPVHVLSAHAERHAGRQLAGDHGPRRRWPGHGAPAGRHAPPRRDRRRGPPAGRGAAGRSQGAGRARHAGRPGPQRRRPRRPATARSS